MAMRQSYFQFTSRDHEENWTLTGTRSLLRLELYLPLEGDLRGNLSLSFFSALTPLRALVSLQLLVH